MKAKIFEGLSLVEIKEQLEAECVNSQTKDYLRPFTEDEELNVQSEFTDQQKEASIIDDEIKKFVDPLKQKKKEHLEEAKNLMQAIKDGGFYEQGKVYDIHDAENGLVITYTESGEIVESRQMNRHEKKQLHINSFTKLSKTGTDG